MREASMARWDEPGESTASSGEAGENEPGVCEAGPVAGTGWIEGDPADRIPADAPLQALLLAASKAMGLFYAGTVVEADVQISPAGLGVLRVLLADDGLKSSDVAARGWSSPGTLTSVVDRLVREGYVQRRPDPADRRVVRLYLTDAGRQACERYVAVAGPRWRAAFDFVSPADEPVIRKFFTEMIDRFGELTRKERGR
jgi:DNA-binding MarR family transcriptional regulator